MDRDVFTAILLVFIRWFTITSNALFNLCKNKCTNKCIKHWQSDPFTTLKKYLIGLAGIEDIFSCGNLLERILLTEKEYSVGSESQSDIIFNSLVLTTTSNIVVTCLISIKLVCHRHCHCHQQWTML